MSDTNRGIGSCIVEPCQGATESQRLLLRAHLAFESCGGLLAAVEIGSAGGVLFATGRAHLQQLAISTDIISGHSCRSKSFFESSSDRPAIVGHNLS